MKTVEERYALIAQHFSNSGYKCIEITSELIKVQSLLKDLQQPDLVKDVKESISYFKDLVSLYGNLAIVFAQKAGVNNETETNQAQH